MATFALPSLSRYASAGGAHDAAVVALLPLGGAALSLSHRQLRLHSSGGLLRYAHEEGGGEEDDAAGFACAALETPAAPRVLLGRGEAPFLQALDLGTGQWLARVDAPGGACVLTHAGRALALGSPTGAATDSARQRAPRSRGAA